MNLIKRFLKDTCGIAAVTASLVIPVILSISLVGIEIGNAGINKNNLQTAANAASLAAVNFASQGNFTTAASAAQQIFNANYTGNGSAQINVTVTQGYIDMTSVVFYPGASQLASGCPSASRCVNAIQTHVTGTIKTLTGSTILKGFPVDITATAIPTNSGKALVSAAYPLAIDQCVMDNYWDSSKNKPYTDQIGQCRAINFGYKVGDPDGKCKKTAQWTTMKSDGDSGDVGSQARTGNAKEVKSSDTIKLITGTANYESYFTVGQEITVPVVEKVGLSSSRVVGFTTVKITNIKPGTSDSGYITGCLTNKSNPKMTRNDGSEKEYGTTTPSGKLVRD
jgi:Flp pilus assembly protein TadG